jgi:uncharacterized protein YegL
MRRLPIYLLVDVSDSMVGESRDALQQGLERIVDELRKNPYALETAYLSIIAFAGKARTLVPLTDILGFYSPNLPIGSGTALGLAMETLMESIDKDVKKSTGGKKGDWQPLVYILTDGKPTDGYEAAFHRWKSDYAHRANVVAIGLGPYADTSVLSEVAENTFTYNGHDEQDFEGMIRWISNSISTVSASPGNVDLSKAISLDKEGVALAPAGTTTRYDQDSVVLVVRCSKSGKPFLVKYDRAKGPSKEEIGFELDLQEQLQFIFSGSHIIDESYFEWTDVAEEASENASIYTDKLVGGFTCPHCGSMYGAVCQCGSLICAPMAEGESVTCPWCKSSGLSFSGNGGPTSVKRSSG